MGAVTQPVTRTLRWVGATEPPGSVWTAAWTAAGGSAGSQLLGAPGSVPCRQASRRTHWETKQGQQEVGKLWEMQNDQGWQGCLLDTESQGEKVSVRSRCCRPAMCQAPSETCTHRLV